MRTKTKAIVILLITSHLLLAMGAYMIRSYTLWGASVTHVIAVKNSIEDRIYLKESLASFEKRFYGDSTLHQMLTEEIKNLKEDLQAANNLLDTLTNSSFTEKIFFPREREQLLAGLAASYSLDRRSTVVAAMDRIERSCACESDCAATTTTVTSH